MAPAIEHRLKHRSLADVERAHTLRPVNLVAGDGEQVASDIVDIDRNLSRRWYGVSVEENAGFGGNSSNLRDGLHDAGLIVGEHNGDQLRVRPDRALHVRRIHQAAAIHGNVGDFASLRLARPVTIPGKMLAGVKYGV